MGCAAHIRELSRLAELVAQRNVVAGQIAALIGRPALAGHVGEFIASEVFGILLEPSATSAGIDGRFQSGPLKGKSVNIKWYGKLEGLLDINPLHLPDFYLVFAGPRSPATSSRGEARPWLIESVYLFDARDLDVALRTRGAKIGVATSVAQRYWHEAEIYPESRNPNLVPTTAQREQLALFSARALSAALK